MKNKLFVRIASAVICVMMLGTLVFAAEPTPVIVAGNSLSFFVGEDNADITINNNAVQITMMAYKVGNDATADAIPDYVDQDTTPMLALDQKNGTAGFGSIPINELISGTKVAVKLGDSDSGYDEYLIEWVEAPVTYTVTYATGYDAELLRIRLLLRQATHLLQRQL